MIDNFCVNYLRLTSVLQIEKANSGHPGICLGAAPIAFSIYKNAIFKSDNSNFLNRDRIVFSAGHASALIYSVLNLFKFNMPVEELKRFRQMGAITCGHPEYDVAPGVDCSTGPLGQGIANAVGMALAEDFLRNRFAKGNLSPINHYTYCLTGDGCLMEGVALEAISLAGSFKLNKLILLYDKNDITIEGDLSITNREDAKSKFLSCNWNVLEVQDGNCINDIDKAISMAKKSDKPTVIIVKTKIGYGCEFEGLNKIHGKPLKREQIDKLRQNLNYFVPDFQKTTEIEHYIENLLDEKNKYIESQKSDLDEYKRKFPKEFSEFIELENYFNFDLSSLINEGSSCFDGREENHKILNLLKDKMPTMIGGSADVAPSSQVFFDDEIYYSYLNRCGRNIPFGIREHAMGAVCNGIALHGGVRPFCSTFFAFSNYMVPAIRMAALMKLPILYFFTHDSIFVGEDGPTHQPVEQIATLRAMPDVYTMRPCGRNELLACYQTYFDKKLPTCIVLPRQKFGYINDDFNLALRGAYLISQDDKSIATIVSTGSDVELCLKASEILKAENIIVNVVSAPCVEIFNEQDKSYRSQVINKSKPVFCVEASSDNIWFKYATNDETIINLTSFGLSGKAEDVCEHFGFTPEKISKRIKDYLMNDKNK